MAKIIVRLVGNAARWLQTSRSIICAGRLFVESLGEVIILIDYLQEVYMNYPIYKPSVSFIRHNENITYMLTDREKKYELRIHKPVNGFSLGIFQSQNKNISNYIESEMNLLNYLGECIGYQIQKPVRNICKEYVTVLSDGTPATLLEWVEGKTLDKVSVSDKTGEMIGVMVAGLHHCTSSLDINFDDEIYSKKLQCKIDRYIYDSKLLNAINMEIRKAVGYNHISSMQGETIRMAIDVIGGRMKELNKLNDMMGIVHSDLSASNMIYADNKVIPIDFSLSGYGYYFMDFGMIFAHYNDRSIRKSILKGYEKTAGISIPLYYIEPFFALSVILYIACQHTKAHEEKWFGGAMKRWSNSIFMPLINNIKFI